MGFVDPDKTDKWLLHLRRCRYQWLWCWILIGSDFRNESGSWRFDLERWHNRLQFSIWRSWQNEVSYLSEDVRVFWIPRQELTTCQHSRHQLLLHLANHGLQNPDENLFQGFIPVSYPNEAPCNGLCLWELQINPLITTVIPRVQPEQAKRHELNRNRSFSNSICGFWGRQWELDSGSLTVNGTDKSAHICIGSIHRIAMFLIGNGSFRRLLNGNKCGLLHFINVFRDIWQKRIFWKKWIEYHDERGDSRIQMISISLLVHVWELWGRVKHFNFIVKQVFVNKYWKMVS